MEINTRYGTLRGCYDEEYYEDGTLKNCNFNAENCLQTGCGVLVPRYGPETIRSKYGKAIGFYSSGCIRRIALEKITGVQSPIGEFPAELITFYESEAICRIFPLNGKITGFWTEENEKELIAPLRFSFNFSNFSAKIISVHFYESGNVQSVTLFPKERIELSLPFGKIVGKTGFSLYENGALQSLEPAEPTSVPTPIGMLHAFAGDCEGITADINSLVLDENGTVTRLSTVTDKIVVQTPEAQLEPVTPVQKMNPLDGQSVITLPVKVEFTADFVRFTCEETRSYPLAVCAFSILSIPYVAASPNCAGCSGCDGFCSSAEKPFH